VSPNSEKESSSTTVPSDRAVRPADQALAENVDLRLSDFSPGWTSAPRTQEHDADAEKRFASCIHTSLSPSDLIPSAAKANSPDFTSPSSQEVSSKIAVAKTASDVASAVDVIASPDVPTCLAQYLDAVLGRNAPSGMQFGQSSVDPESFNALGDRTVAYRITVPVSSKGQRGNVYVDFIVVQKGRVGVIFQAVETLSPFPTDMSAALIRKMLARVPVNSR
jgi:hypothetical protein